jgi:ADP-ribosylglycohydrolase
MWGAIVGDIAGVSFEFEPIKSKDFEFYPTNRRKLPTFSDDTVLTLAVAQHLMTKESLVKLFHEFVRKEPKRGYGSTFGNWVRAGKTQPYNSYGNGSAMRVSPVGWFYDGLDEVLKGAKASAEVTHDHPEGIKGAQSTAVAIYLARTGTTKDDIKTYIEGTFGYDLSRKLDDIRPTYSFKVSCQESVPEAIICFLESTDFEDTIRNAVSLGGDADTQACIAGSIAEAFYKDIPEVHVKRAISSLPSFFRSIAVKFNQVYVEPKKRAKA